MAGDSIKLQNIILSFRVSELLDLLDFAGRNKRGKKRELQSRALDLIKLCSAPVQAKILELHQRRCNSNKSSDKQTERVNPVSAPHMYRVETNNLSPDVLSHAGMHPGNNASMGGYQQNIPYNSHLKSVPLNVQNLPSPGPSYPVYPDVQLKPLPFYDVMAVLLKPSSLISSGDFDTSQETNFTFHLSPQQVHDIVSSRVFTYMNTIQYINQIQLRFCLLETSCEQDDNIPPNILVKVNNKSCSLPNPIPTNKLDAEPKRPSRPINITHICELSVTTANTIAVTWASEYGRHYVIAVYLVKKLDSKTLLSRLRTKGMRNPDYTQAMIKEKLVQSPDSEIVTTSLRGSLLCPIGKMKMTIPCRPNTCAHLQCFDADLFIKMNEKKPQWICPVCDQPAPFKSLTIDGLFSEISAKAPLACLEVQFHEDGSWTPIINQTEVHDVDSSTVHNCSPVRKQAKKEVEVVDLTIDSDTEEDWYSSSSVDSPVYQQSSLDASMLPSTSGIMCQNRVPPLTAAPFIDLSSLSSPIGISPFVPIAPSSPAPPVVSGSSQPLATPQHMSITGQANISKPAAAATVTSLPTIKEKWENDAHYSTTDTYNSLVGGNMYPNMPFMNPSPQYYAPGSSPPTRDDLASSSQSFNKSDSDFDFYSLLHVPDTEQIPRTVHSSHSVLDVISLD